MIYLGERVELARLHYSAVESWFLHRNENDQHRLQVAIMQLPGMEQYTNVDGASRYGWLEGFVLADLQTMREWVNHCPEKLRFTDFYELYVNKFAKGSDTFVDPEKRYNATVLQNMLNVGVCPYCDDMRIQVLDNDGKMVRTGEFDHYYPKAKDKFPALAMCFFNLVISCHTCNKIKMESPIGESPYEHDIEFHSRFVHNIDVGMNIACFPRERFSISLQATEGMSVNEKVLALTKRYALYADEAYEMLGKAQKYPIEKLEEVAKILGENDVDSIRRDLFGSPYDEGRLKYPHQKMKKDLIGY